MAEQDETPSTREQRLQELIAAYLKACEAGEGPDQEQWLARYPEYAGPLASFFAEHEQMRRVAGPFRPGAEVGPAETVALLSATARPSETPSAGVDRYRLQRFHARGGMGEVWVAEDCRINRPVAVKRLRGDRPDLRERFDDEAQITGQLEHPAVVPVHDSGVDADGRPFYVMKFVHGTTLKEVVRDFHCPEGPVGSEREVAWTRLLKVFIDLCQAVAFAHSRGVVHRDLKPDNVMLGPYGETLLLDWGLAKVAAQGERASAGESSTPVRLSHASGSTKTDAGSVLGTPSYMAPEVAEGHVESADPRTDVYLLGATLYEMLTGLPPRRGSSLPEMVQLARTVDPAPPRKIDPRISRPLEAICRKALARRATERYATAQDLAHDVERFLAGEPVSAYREGVLERAARWIKRHRRAIGRIAVASLVVGVMAFAFLALRKAQRIEEQERARRDVESFQHLSDEARYHLAGTDAPDERAPYYDPERGEASAQAAGAEIRKWGDHLERLPLPDQQDRCKDDLYGLLLLLVQSRLSRHVGQPQQSLELLNQAASLADPSRGYYRLQAEVFGLLNEDAKRAQATQRAEAAETRTTALDFFLVGEDYRMRTAGPRSGATAGPPDGNLLAKAVEQYGKALEKDPRHYWSHFQLGRCYLAMGRGPEAVQSLATCVALRPEAPWAHSARGLALARLSRFDEAEQELQRTIRQHPGFLPARLNHGAALWLRSRQADAPAERDAMQREAMAALDAVLQPPSPATPLIEAALYRGQIHLDRSEVAQALADFGRVISERPRFALVYALRAKTHFLAGNSEAGLQDLTTLAGIDGEQVRSTGFSRNGVGKPPEGGTTNMDPDSAQACQQRGAHLRRLAADLEGAAQSRVLDLALEQLDKALQRGGRSAALFDDLGAALELRGRLVEAIGAYSQGLAQVEHRPAEHARLYVKRGWAYTKLEDQSQFKKALVDFSQAMRLDPRDAEACSGVSYALACLKAPMPAPFTAHTLRRGGDDYLILHNLACVFAEVSRSAGAEAKLWQDVALSLLHRAVELWKTERGRQGGAIPNERDLIRTDPALKPLHARPEFEKVLKDD